MAKPYTLSGAPTAAMMGQIDEMFHLLFQETGDITRVGASGTFLRSNGLVPSWELIEETDIQDGDLFARVADAEAITGAWTFSQDVLPATDDGPSLGSGALRWDTLHAMIVSATTRVTTPLITTASGNLAVTPAAGSSVVTTLSGAAGFFDITSSNTAGTNLRLLNTDTGGKTWRFISSGSANTGGAGNLLIVNVTDGVTMARISASQFNVLVDAAFGIVDTNASHFLRFDCGSNLTADRILSFVTGDAARTITFSGNPTLSDWFDQSVKTTASPTFAALTLTAALTVANGGSGRATATAYAVICGGTTATGAHQSIASVGTSGQVLTSNGAGALPTFQNAAAGGGERTPQRSSATGAQADFDLTDGHTWLILDGAAPVISGFEVAGTTPSDGDSVLIDYVGTGTCRIEDESTGTGSTAANRVIGQSVRGQIVGEKGRILCVYDGTAARWRMTCISPGEFIEVAYNSGDFVAQSGTWTVESGDMLRFAYQQNGQFLIVALNLADSTLATSTSAELRVTLPNSFAVRATALNVAIINDTGGGAYETGRWRVGVGDTYMGFRQMDGTNWPLATNVIGIQGTLHFEVN